MEVLLSRYETLLVVVIEGEILFIERLDIAILVSDAAWLAKSRSGMVITDLSASAPAGGNNSVLGSDLRRWTTKFASAGTFPVCFSPSAMCWVTVSISYAHFVWIDARTMQFQRLRDNH